MIRTTLLLILISDFCYGQSLILKGHLINSNTEQPISGARVYVMGGDAESQTTSSGQYRLNLGLGDKTYEYGDEVDIYILHDFYGFHKSSVILAKSQQADIFIEPDNMVKITGTVLDGTTHSPVPNISVVLIDELNLEKNKNRLVRETNEYGAYYFLVSKSILGGQNYIKFQFVDIENKDYTFKEEILNVNSHSTVYVVPSPAKMLSEMDMKLDPNTREALQSIITKNSEIDSFQIRKSIEDAVEFGIRYSTLLVPPDVFFRIPDNAYQYSFSFFVSTDGKKYIEVKNRHQLDKTRYDSLFVKLVCDDLQMTIGPKVLKEEFVVAAREKIIRSVKNISNNVIEFFPTHCKIDQNWMIDSYAEKLTLVNLRSNKDWELDITDLERKYSIEENLCFTPHVNMFKLYPGDIIECILAYNHYEDIIFRVKVKSFGNYLSEGESGLVELKPFQPEQYDESPIILVEYNGTFNYPSFKVSGFHLIRGCSNSAHKIKKMLIDVDGQGLVELDWQHRLGFDLPKQNELLLVLELESGDRIGPFRYKFDVNEILEAATWNCDEPRLKIYYDSDLKSKVAKYTDRFICLKDVQKIIYGVKRDKMNETIVFNINFEEIIKIHPRYKTRDGYDQLPKIVIPENASNIYYKIFFSDGSTSAVIRLPVR